MTMKRLIYLLPLILVGCFGTKGLDVQKVEGDLTKPDQDIIDHSNWDDLLGMHVNDSGFVDYQAFQTDKDELDKYLAMLAENPPEGDWPVEEQLAYFINLYNAATVQLILDNYPVGSIKDIGTISPFTINFIQVGEEEMSLANLEKGILQSMNEPRMHFAINCASKSCPPLLDEAFTASKIADQLEQVTTNFINSDYNKIDAQNPELSKIFDWYKSDFTASGKSLIEYINQYSDTEINDSASVSYLNYDWSLNEQQ